MTKIEVLICKQFFIKNKFRTSITYNKIQLNNITNKLVFAVIKQLLTIVKKYFI